MLHRLSSSAIVLLAVALLTACGPEERIWWSPLGDRAVVEIDDQLFLVAPDGPLGDALPLPDTVEDSITSVDWLPDGSAIMICRSRGVTTWAATRELIPDEEAREVEALMPTVLPTLELGARFADQPASLEALLGLFPALPSTTGLSALRAVHERETAAMEKLLLALPDGKDLVEWLRDARFEVSEVLRIDLDGAGGPRGKCILRSIADRFVRLACAPDGRTVALARRPGDPNFDGEDAAVVLEVVALADGAALTSAHPAGLAFDWHPDGQSVIFAAPDGPGGSHIIRRLTVGAEGEAPVDLATVLLPEPPHLEVLPDGRILFAGQRLTLPRLASAEHPPTRLHLLSGDGDRLTPVPADPEGRSVQLSRFRASPDGRRVALVDGPTDAVVLIDLATGRTSTISPAHPDWRCGTIPAWRSSEAVSFAGLTGDPPAPAWMLWTQADGVTCLSGKWPPDSTADWLTLEEKPDAPAPAGE